MSDESLPADNSCEPMAFPSTSGASPFGNNFKGGGINNHKRPGQGKKLVIKNRKVKPDLPDNYGEESLEKLRVSIRAVFNQHPISYVLEELYQAVENMCSHGMAAKLYEHLEEECRNHIMAAVPVFQREAVDDLQFLSLVNNQWTDHCRQMIMIRSIFLYLDRTYAMANPSISSIWDLGLRLFESLIINHSRVLERVIDGVINLINKERCHESVDRGLAKSLLRMLGDLQLYQDDFEIKFLQKTESLYHTEALEILRGSEFTLPNYLAHIDKRLSQENDRVLHYLHKSTRKPLILCVEKKLVGEHLEEILKRGFESLLEASRCRELSMLYSFFIRFKEGQCLVCKAFGEFIKKSGAAIVSDPERDKVMVQELLELKTKMDNIVVKAFQDNIKFYDVLRESFESVINRRQNKPAELIAKYVDAQLKSGNKEWSDEEMDKLLDKVMVLFRYIHGKDVFEAFYKKDLAKRLLLGKSASFDAEKSMLLKLKQECGSNFTSKLEGMFRDMEISREMMSSFKETRRETALGAIDLNVNVLTMIYWPPYTPVEVILPVQMAKYLEAFKSFYIGKYNNRNLQWQPSLGHCVLKAVLPHGEKELQVSLFQALVLLLFNSVDVLTYIDIREQTGIESDELQRTLQSLSLGKVRVLLKSPKVKAVTDTDTFHFNKQFKHKLCRIKINQVQLRETVEENVATNERVFQDRQYQVDAAIVRIMKMRRSLPHNLLLSECLGQLRFHIRPADLKKRIESLIDRDYIRRSKENSSIYEYIV